MKDSLSKEEIKDFNVTHTINLKWCEIQVKKKRLSKTILKQLPKMIEHLDFVYPNKWDLQIRKILFDNTYISGIPTVTSQIFLQIVIKFDSVTIINEHKNNIVINDLYVAIPLETSSNNKMFIPSIKGSRGQLSNLEIVNKYAHSHLHSFDKNITQNFSNFCLGSGGVSSTLLMLNASWDNERFKLLLFQIEEYVAWESLEGGPYKKLESITAKRGIVKTNISLKNIHKLYEKIDLELHIDDVDIDIENTYCVANNEKLENALLRILPDEYKVYKDINGKMYPIITDDDTLKMSNIKTDLVWKQVPLNYIRISANLISKGTEKKYINTNIKQIIIEYLNTKLLKHFVSQF